jgi:cation diffusion facilitator CzcD-associated flavoprotein CzcO
MTEVVDVVVIGAGQAGLALSYELTHAGVEHVVLERGRVGETWRGRWDSFCLVTPNWTVQLPGGHYQGDDPDGFMPRDEIVSHLVGYAQSFRAPVQEGVEVSALGSSDGRGFLLRTSSGEVRALRVVLASGGYQKPHRPPGADQLPASLHVIDAEDYTNPEALPPGQLLVVGSGQTGCQLAEDLLQAGRDVYLACGRAPWFPRRLGDRDTVAWVVETPFLETTLADLPSPLARLGANPQASGRRGGHDLHYRTLHALGVNLLGHFVGAKDGVARFAPDLAESVAFGDARYAALCGLIRTSCAERGVEAPEMPPPPPFAASPPERLDLSRLGAVIFTSGFRPDYTSWVRFPEAFDEQGFPIQQDGSSTIVPGLHFMGVHFQRKRKSATFLGVAEDAVVLAERIVARRGQDQRGDRNGQDRHAEGSRRLASKVHRLTARSR